MYILKTSPARQYGFSLIEVLITLVVLSIGLLGIAGLHATAKRSGHQAWQRTMAVTLADDLIERIRINPGQAGAYHTGLGEQALGGGSITAAPDVDCSTEPCTPPELAAWDLWDWEQRLDGATVLDANANSVGGLIEPRACVVLDPADGTMPNSGRLRVIVTWRGTTETSDAVQGADEICGSDGADSDAGRRQLTVNTYVVDNEDLYP